MPKYSDPRDATFEVIYDIATQDKDVVMLTADTGARKFRDFQENIPDQFINVGICEQNAMSVAGGLASTGKKVFVYGIGTFVTTRCFEQIKIDICCMNRAVTIIGMSTGYGYSGDGPTHHIIEDIALMRALPNMTIWSPSDCNAVAHAVQASYESETPSYMRFDKQIFTPIYGDAYPFREGFCQIGDAADIVFVATSIMTSRAMKLVESLKSRGVRAGVIDVYRLKPLSTSSLAGLLQESDNVVIMEEHSVYGGLGSIVKEVMADYRIDACVKHFGIPDVFRSEVGSRDYLCSLDGIDNESIMQALGV